eukprot:Rmarinus@m.605
MEVEVITNKGNTVSMGNPINRDLHPAFCETEVAYEFNTVGFYGGLSSRLHRLNSAAESLYDHCRDRYNKLNEWIGRDQQRTTHDCLEYKETVNLSLANQIAFFVPVAKQSSNLYENDVPAFAFGEDPTLKESLRQSQELLNLEESLPPFAAAPPEIHGAVDAVPTTFGGCMGYKTEETVSCTLHRKETFDRYGDGEAACEDWLHASLPRPQGLRQAGAFRGSEWQKPSDGNTPVFALDKVASGVTFRSTAEQRRQFVEEEGLAEDSRSAPNGFLLSSGEKSVHPGFSLQLQPTIVAGAGDPPVFQDAVDSSGTYVSKVAHCVVSTSTDVAYPSSSQSHTNGLRKLGSMSVETHPRQADNRTDGKGGTCYALSGSVGGKLASNEGNRASWTAPGFKITKNQDVSLRNVRLSYPPPTR